MTALERHYRLWLLLVWLASAAIMIALCRDAIAAFRFPDPDDIMRLVEVRDWMAGQSWFDVGQHRMNLPDGLSMHWSRLLDVPLAALIALFKPLFGQRIAETIAAVTVPMLTLGATMALVAEITRRRSGAVAALLAAAACMLSIGAWYAMRPLRIDHHGWQIVAGLGIVLALAYRRDLRGAAIAGLCAAAWTHISLEGLAFTAGAAVWLGLRWIASPAERYRLPLFLGTLCAAGSLFYFSIHGISLLGTTFCDQISPVHLLLFGLAALLTAITVRLSPAALPMRAAAMAMAALPCAAFYRLGAPQCAAGPFGALGPLGYRLWYLNVDEGVPLWHLPLPQILLWGIFPWIGLAGAALVCLAPKRDAAAIDYGIMLGIATIIGLFVTRTGAFANILAVPGAVALILAAFARTEPWPIAPRVVARSLAILLLSPIGAALAAVSVPAHTSSPSPPPAAPAAPRCGQIDTLVPLDRFAPATIMAPLYLGPPLIAGTHHAAVTGPYHRDPAALEDVLRFFTADPATAHRIAGQRNAKWLIFCPADSEVRAMAKYAPDGLAANLLRGRLPGWLKGTPLPDAAGLTIYRVD